MEPPADDPAPPATDWFGNPLRPAPPPVPCPTCGEPFADRSSFEAHLAASHGVRPRRTRSGGRSPALRGSQPALGRNRRSPLARWLARTPLVLVVAVNLVGILAAYAALDVWGGSWWAGLQEQPWSRAVVVPMLWPTVLFLLLRGIE